MLAALALVCAARVPLVTVFSGSAGRARRSSGSRGRRLLPLAGVGAAAVGAGLIVLAGLPRETGGRAWPLRAGRREGAGGLRRRDAGAPAARTRRGAERSRRALVAALDQADDALRTRDASARRGDRRPVAGSQGSGRRSRTPAGGAIDVPSYELERVRLRLEPGDGTGAADDPRGGDGTRLDDDVRGAPRARDGAHRAPSAGADVRARRAGRALPARRRCAAHPETERRSDAPRVVHAHGRRRARSGSTSATMRSASALTRRRDGDDGRRRLLARLRRRRPARPLRRQHLRRDGHPRLRGARRAADEPPLPQPRRPLRGRDGEDGAGLAVRGSGCVAADLDGNGATDLYVTTAGYDAGRDAFDALLWNEGDGTFTEGAWTAGLRAFGWHAGRGGRGRERRRAARPLRRGLHRPERPAAELDGGIPREPPRRARPPLPEPGATDSFREVGARAGLEPHGLEHGLGAVFTDVDLRRAPRPLRRERPRPEPALPQRREARRPARLPAGRAGPAPPASTIRTRGWGSRQATGPATGSTTSS